MNEERGRGKGTHVDRMLNAAVRNRNDQAQSCKYERSKSDEVHGSYDSYLFGGEYADEVAVS